MCIVPYVKGCYLWIFCELLFLDNLFIINLYINPEYIVIMCAQREWEAAFNLSSQQIYVKALLSLYVDGLVIRLLVYAILVIQIHIEQLLLI